MLKKIKLIFKQREVSWLKLEIFNALNTFYADFYESFDKIGVECITNNLNNHKEKN